MKHAPSSVVVLHKAFPLSTQVWLSFFFFFFLNLTTLHSEYNFVLAQLRNLNGGGPIVSLQPVCRYIHHLLSNRFPVLRGLIWRYARKGRFYFTDVCRGPNEWPTAPPALVWTRTPQVVGAESSFRPWSLWTGSVALLAQVIDQIESTVMPLGVADGGLPLVESRRGGSVSSLYSLFISIPFISCHLVDLAVLSP